MAQQFYKHDSEDSRLEKLRKLALEVATLSQARSTNVVQAGRFTASEDGLVPAPGLGDRRYLSSEGTWIEIVNGQGPPGPQGPQGIQGPTGPAGADGVVQAVLGTTDEIDVDSTDPANPVVSLAAAAVAGLVLAGTALQPADIGVSVQAYSVKLDAYAGGDTPSAFTLGIVDSADAAAWRAAIGAGTSTVTPAALTKTDDTNVTLTLGGTPATALLQAASLTLGWTGQLSVARGGTGAGTLTGHISGNGTGAFTASATIPGGDLVNSSVTYAKIQNVSATSRVLGRISSGAGVIEELTGTNIMTILSASGLGPANPSASVGLSAVNGSATTYMRSDGAPALSQAIVPTWTGAHIFAFPFASEVSTMSVANSFPVIEFSRTTNGTDLKRWIWLIGTGGNLAFQKRSDSGGGTNRDVMTLVPTGAIWATEDNYEFQAGTGKDLRLYHDGTNSYIRNDTGILRIMMATTKMQVLGTGTGASAQSYIEFCDSAGTALGHVGDPASADRMSLSSYTGGIDFSSATLMRFYANGSDQDFEIGIGYVDTKRTMRWTNAITPAQLTTNTNDWAPTGLSAASVIRADTNAAGIQVTGLTGGTAGRVLVLINIGSNTLVLPHNSGSSSAANRFLCASGSTKTLQAGGSVILWYDGTSTAWRLISLTA